MRSSGCIPDFPLQRHAAGGPERPTLQSCRRTAAGCRAWEPWIKQKMDQRMQDRRLMIPARRCRILCRMSLGGQAQEATAKPGRTRRRGRRKAGHRTDDGPRQGEEAGDTGQVSGNDGEKAEMKVSYPEMTAQNPEMQTRYPEMTAQKPEMQARYPGNGKGNPPMKIRYQKITVERL